MLWKCICYSKDNFNDLIVDFLAGLAGAYPIARDKEVINLLEISGDK